MNGGRTGYCFSGKAGLAALAEWLRGRFPKACFVYLEHGLREGESGVRLRAGIADDFQPRDWELGRVFGAELELRFRTKGDEAELLLSQERPGLPAWCTELCAWERLEEDYEAQPTEHVLVGTYYEAGGFFAEAAIPRAFRYPTGPGAAIRRGARAVLEGRHYRRAGTTVLTRFSGFRIESEPDAAEQA